MFLIGKRLVFLFTCMLCVTLVSCGDNDNNSLVSISEEISSNMPSESENTCSSEESVSQIISSESDYDLQSVKSNIETKEEDENKFGEFC